MSDAALVSLLRAAPMGIGMVVDRVLTEVNDVLCAMVGYEREELIGKSARIFYPDDAEFDYVGREKYRQIGEQGRGSVQTRFRRKSGEIVNVLLSSSPIDVRDLRQGVTFTAVDITALVHAEEELRQSEQRQRAILEALPDLVFQLRRDGTFVSYSARDEEGLLIRPSEFLGRRAEEVLPEDLAHLTIASIERALDSGSTVSYTYSLPFAEGVRWFEARMAPFQGDDVLAIVRDVTDRKLAEEALHRSEEHKQLIFRSLPVAVYAAPLGPIADATWISGNVEALTGFPPQYFLDEAHFWRDRIHPDDRPAALEAFSHATARGSVEVEYRWQVADGSYRWFLDRGVVREGGDAGLEIVGTFLDVTERKQAAETSRENEERYRQLFEMESDALFLIENEGGRILEANTSASALYGYSHDELLSLRNVDLSSESAETRRITTTGRGRELVPVRWHRKRDGTIFPVEITGSFFEFGGRPVHIAAIRDITRRLQLEEELLQAQKMEAIGRLAGGVAHDFNNLLQAMLSLSATLRASPEAPAEMADRLEELDARIKLGATLTRQLLLFARRETGRREPLDLATLLQETSSLLRRLLRENIALRLEIPGEPLVVMADRGQLEQVIMNLAVNAADAMPAGGKLALRAEATGSDRASVIVNDSGSGIPADIREKVFDPFFTTKAGGKGTGLGLSVVHGIVTAHDGTIAIDSTEGQGTTVRITFPREPAVEAPALSPAPLPTPPRGRGERLLVVEDEDLVRTGLAELLEMLTYQVTTAASAEAALRIDVDEPFDLLLTDLVLPGMAGTDLAAALIQRMPHLCVVYMSGYSEDTALRHRAASGTVHFLEKPFDTYTLACELRAALGER